MEEWIIADSGGTKTDWCRVSAVGLLERLHTESYHPVYASEERLARMQTFWDAHPKWKTLPLYFFGSGCYRAEGKRKVEEELHQLGFEQIKVQSDVHAAAWATLGSSPGYVAILGTGSVLIEWDGAEVSALHGGKGHLEGDEGSGFYFGRLLMEKYALHSLDLPALESLSDFLAGHPHFPDPSKEKAQLAVLAQTFAGQLAFEPVHRENLRYFIERYVKSIPAGTTVHCVGSYGAAQATLFEVLLAENGYISGQILARPIERLVEQSARFID
jgi:hypothetical protein